MNHCGIVSAWPRVNPGGVRVTRPGLCVRRARRVARARTIRDQRQPRAIRCGTCTRCSTCPCTPTAHRCPRWRRSRPRSLRAGCWCGRGGGDRSSRYRCSAGSTPPATRLIGCCGSARGPHPATEPSAPISRSGPSRDGSGPRGIFADRPGRGGGYPGSAGSGSDRSRDQAPAAPGPRPPHRADRRAPPLRGAAAVGRWA
jgi:hypothetical protein